MFLTFSFWPLLLPVSIIALSVTLILRLFSFLSLFVYLSPSSFVVVVCLSVYLIVFACWLVRLTGWLAIYPLDTQTHIIPVCHGAFTSSSLKYNMHLCRIRSYRCDRSSIDSPADSASFSCSNKLYLQYLLFICGSYHFVKSPTGLCAAVRHDVVLLYVLLCLLYVYLGSFWCRWLSPLPSRLSDNSGEKINLLKMFKQTK